jgi:outer membrane protein OmpA-like peptidoglycan-associated protein
MAIDILGLVKGALTPDAVSSVASSLGESPDGIQKAFSAGIPALLSGVMNKATSGGSELSTIMSLFSSGAANPGILQNFSSLASGSGAFSLIDGGKSVVGSVLGDNASSVANAISSHSGISATSASSVLAMAAPLIMGGIAKALPGGVTPSSLTELLTSQKSSILSALPAGLSGLAGIGGVASAVSSFGSSTVRKMETAVPSMETPQGGMKMWPILAVVGALIVAGLIWYFYNSNTAKNAADTASNAASNAAGSVSTAASSAFAALGDLFARKLPNGIEINIPKLGVENKLIDFLDSSAPVDKTTWFNFDRLLFDTGKATLQQPTSDAQLDAIAAILKAYPKVHMRIGGYTDNTGNKAANLKLSQDRADTVMNALIAKGVDASRLDAKGFGEEHPVADNSTDEGRQQNRRIAMRVTEK